jgi:FkbM family methyltransferase
MKFSIRPLSRRPEVNNLGATADDIRYAYRLLLGREPDPDGFAAHRRLISEQPLRARDVAQAFLASDEYRAQTQGDGMISVSMPGYSLFVSPNDRDISAPIAMGHAYEPYVEAAIREVLRPGDTFVDVGANIGYFTALAAHLVGPEGKVIAWEPLDKNIQLIYATIWENRFRNVTVFPFAASSDVGLVAMTSHPLSSNAGITPRQLGEKRTRVIAQSQRLDDQLATLERLDVIKFDIEGHELHAWRGASSLLAKHKPHVFTEFHPKCIRANTDFEPSEYLKVLLEYSAPLEVLHRTRPRVSCFDVDSVMREWQIADKEFGMDGGMHIDIHVRPSGN